MDQEKLQEARQDLERLQTGCQSLQLATVDTEGQPHTSYAPFARYGQGFVVYLSELAAHYHNLVSEPRASVMLIDDEAATRQIFARKRYSAPVTAHRIDREGEAGEAAFAALEGRFGAVMQHLRTMQDFHLFQLMPGKGTLVTGFGSAFEVETGENGLELNWLRGEHGKAGAGRASTRSEA